MMEIYRKIACLLLAGIGLISCNERIENPQLINEYPAIIPDYAGVTIPYTIAPLHFTMADTVEKIHVMVTGSEEGSLEIQDDDYASFPVRKWHALLEKNKGRSIDVTVTVKKEGKWMQYKTFPVYISEYPIDYGLVYRLIAPGYEIYGKMGIYQRDLSDFKQTALLENTLIPGSCVNCHSFKQTDTKKMSLHVRGEYGGTLLQIDDQMEILDLKSTETSGRGVYPYWHPSGEYIAYSINDTRQVFHAVDKKKIEVLDLSSDITVYDVKNNKILTTPLLKTTGFETFPSFSPDGGWLYFCLSDEVQLPAGYEDVRYNLCRIAFDPVNGAFGNKIDTLVNARAMGKSISFPRPSYDGKYIMYTLADYGNFSIWHREADLWLLNLETGENRPLMEVNSDDTESYHSWSSNSRWFVFSTRREDGLYTRLYIASIDEKGHVSKPFRLPEANPSAHDPLFYSFNIPEFVSAPVQLDVMQTERKLLSKERK